jgi:CDP-diacylglycerol--glycerol-3-phosphate 3-phosphatidyltransferase
VATETRSARGIRSARVLHAGSSLRILLAPVVMGFVVSGADGTEAAAAALFTFAAATDFVDGRLARHWGVASPLGSFLDTTADKLLVSTVLIALVAEGRVSPWIAAIIVGRELFMLGLRAAVAVQGTVLKTSSWGRVKTAVQFLAVLLAILRPEVELGGVLLDQWAMLVAAAVTLASAADYVGRFASALRTTG